MVRDGDFLGVVAEREEVALRAADRLRADATWEQKPSLPDEDDLPAIPDGGCRRHHGRSRTGHRSSRGAAPVVVGDLPSTVHRPRVDRTVLRGRGGTRTSGLQIWSHSQGVHILRREIARELGMRPEQFVVRHVEGAGCYGHNGADDAAMDAALLALAAPGRPVQVVWSRPDELAWAPLGTAGVVRLSADTASDGTVLSWRHEIWSGSFISRPGMTPTARIPRAPATATAPRSAPAREPPLERGGGTRRNAVPGYDFPSYEVVNHLIPAMPLRTSALRSLGAHLNVFAAESFMDELAADAGLDPVEFRLAHLSDPRGRAVLEPVVRRSNWAQWTRSDSSVTASAMRATRTRAPTARSSPRWRPSSRCGCAD